MKSILITGSNGLLGQKLLKLLSGNTEYKVIATARGENRVSETTGFEFHSLDICNENAVLSLINEVKPDYIINTAAMTNVDQCEDDKEECWDLNVNAVSYLTKAAEQTGAFLLHLSTDFIFDGLDGPYLEDAKPNPLSYYGDSKLAAEKVLSESSIDWAIARTVLVYGITEKMSRSNIILWVKNSLEEGKNLTIVDDQWRSPTLAEDLAMGCFLIVKNHAKGIYNISGKDVLTPYEMAMQTVDFFGLDASLIEKTDGSKFKQKAKRPAKTGFIIDKAVNEIGYKPHSFMEGIKILSQQVAEQQ
jgi:dTDP-4-dehydrorhamnose reductase